MGFVVPASVVAPASVVVALDRAVRFGLTAVTAVPSAGAASAAAGATVFRGVFVREMFAIAGLLTLA
jgi:hypothetical protein